MLFSLDGSVNKIPKQRYQGPILSTWINFSPSMYRWSQVKFCDEIPCPFLSFNDAIVDVWEWISDFIPHFIMDVITYQSMLVKEQ